MNNEMPMAAFSKFLRIFASKLRKAEINKVTKYI